MASLIPEHVCPTVADLIDHLAHKYGCWHQRANEVDPTVTLKGGCIFKQVGTEPKPRKFLYMDADIGGGVRPYIIRQLCRRFDLDADLIFRHFDNKAAN